MLLVKKDFDLHMFFLARLNGGGKERRKGTPTIPKPTLGKDLYFCYATVLQKTLGSNTLDEKAVGLFSGQIYSQVSFCG